MSLLVACPVILPPTDRLVASWDHRPHLLIVNGAVGAWREVGVTYKLEAYENVGVARSWNLALGVAAQDNIDYVALVSQGTILDHGTGRLAELVQRHADWRGLLTDFAWHCIVLSVALWEQVGPFDETFFAYSEDCDYVYRLALAGLHTPENPIPKVGRDLLDGEEQTALALKAGLIDRSVYGESAATFVRKWGGPPGFETFTEPYGGAT